MSELIFEVGIGLWGEVRDFLSVTALRCPNVRWHESRGWISKTFIVVGPPSDIQNISAHIQRWVKENHLEHRRDFWDTYNADGSRKGK